MDRELCDTFCRFAVEKLGQQSRQVARCAGMLSDEEAWQRTNSHTNSVANLLLHLNGNVRQWAVAGLGGVEFERDRPAEFAARGPRPVQPIVADLTATVQRASDIIRQLGPDELAARYRIQGYEVHGLEAVFHVVEHFSGHTGQIVHMVKVIRDIDLSLYDAWGRKLKGGEAP